MSATDVCDFGSLVHRATVVGVVVVAVGIVPLLVKIVNENDSLSEVDLVDPGPPPCKLRSLMMVSRGKVFNKWIRFSVSS